MSYSDIHKANEVFSPRSPRLENVTSKQRAATKELSNKYRAFLVERLHTTEPTSDDMFQENIINYMLENAQEWNANLEEPTDAFSSVGKVEMLFFNRAASWMADTEKRRGVLQRCFEEGTFLKTSTVSNPQEGESSEEEEAVKGEAFLSLTAALEAEQGTGGAGMAASLESAEPEPDGSMDRLGDLFLDSEQKIPMSQLAPINWVHEGNLLNIAKGRAGWHMDRDGKDEDHGGYTMTLSGNGASTQWLPINVFPAVSRLCADSIRKRFTKDYLSAKEQIQSLQIQFLFEADSWIQQSGLLQTIPAGTILADRSCFNKVFHRTNMDTSESRIFFNISESTFRRLV